MLSPLLQTLKQSILAYKPKRILLGFSGGLDSSALLHALVMLKHQSSALDNIPIIAIHVHHGLSVNADDWLKHCECICQNLNVECITEKVLINTQGGSVEDAARQARYQVFKKQLTSADALLLAHHQDDQVETFMMRLMRGSGLTGLSAMRVQRTLEKGYVLRPWLDVSREQLEEFVVEHKIAYIEDESNKDIQFDRNWWRQDLLPRLFKRYPQASNSIVKTIEVLQAEHQVLQDLIEPIFKQSTDFDDKFTQSLRLNNEALLQQPFSVQVQLIRMWLDRQNIYPLLNGKQVEQLIQDVVHAKIDAEPVYQWQQHKIRRFNGHLYLSKNHSPLSTDSKTQPNNDTRISLSIPCNQTSLALSKVHPSFIGSIEFESNVISGLKQGCYQLGIYDGSLCASPLKRPTKKLKKWFQEYGVPPWLRASWPLIFAGSELAAVPNLFICKGFSSESGIGLKYLQDR